MGEIKKVDGFGATRYYNGIGQPHRDGDEPAVIWEDGSKAYYVNGTCHRDGDKPAIIESDGTKKYYKNGELHRDGDEPAIIWSDGTKMWFWNGKHHRDGDKPAIIFENGSVQYYVNGVLQNNKPNKITDLSWAKWSVEDIQTNLPSGHSDVDLNNLLYQFFKENNESLVQHINFEMKEWLKDKVNSVLSQEQKALKVLNKKGFSAWLSNNKVSVLAWDSTGKDNMNMLIDEEEVNKLAQEYDVLNNPKG